MSIINKNTGTGMEVENFEKICRTCLSEETLLPISSNYVQDGVFIMDVLSDFILPWDLENQLLPQKICAMCVDQLNLYLNFKKNCQKNETFLKLCLENHTRAIETKCIVKNEDDFDNISECNNSIYSSTDDDLPLIDRISKSQTNKISQIKKSASKNKKRKLKQIKEDLKNEKGGEKNYTCQQCNKSFQFKYKLVIHARVHTKEKPFKCDKCKLSFSLNGNLKRHKMTHSGERPHICQICGKGFIQATSLQTHLNKHYSNSSRPNFNCEICGRMFVRAIPYNLHMKKYHSAEVVGQLAEKPEEQKIDKAMVQYKCAICDREFAKLVYLQRHKFKHGEKKFLCSDCGKGFVRKADLRSHIKVHTGEKPHKCPICNKLFAHAGSLVTHSLVHSGYKPYNCYICKKSFSQLSHLKVHQRIHNGERPYSCSYCTKTFALKSNLTVHIRIHTGETPYVCTVCGRGFYDSSSLKKHKSSHLSLLSDPIKRELVNRQAISA